ncbi:helix-turn-helix domain-containing protein [Paraclostridium sp.]|uniref:helix-turn-helix domain-containing protein n=1 Tax=Paraclostridium sp. TaxID=2023273 RepID=UPI003F67D44E
MSTFFLEAIFIKIKLNEFIKERDITLYKLAKDAGIDYSTLHNVANNNPKSLMLHNLDKICTALDCKIEDILESEKVEL